MGTRAGGKQSSRFLICSLFWEAERCSQFLGMRWNGMQCDSLGLPCTSWVILRKSLPLAAALESVLCVALSVCLVTIALISPVDQFHSSHSCVLCEDPAWQPAQEPLAHCGAACLHCWASALVWTLAPQRRKQGRKESYLHTQNNWYQQKFWFYKCWEIGKWVYYGKVYKINLIIF